MLELTLKQTNEREINVQRHGALSGSSKPSEPQTLFAHYCDELDLLAERLCSPPCRWYPRALVLWHSWSVILVLVFRDNVTKSQG